MSFVLQLFALQIICPTERGKHHLSYRAGETSFVLQSRGNIICPTERGKHHLSYKVETIICSTHH